MNVIINSYRINAIQNRPFDDLHCWPSSALVKVHFDSPFSNEKSSNFRLIEGDLSSYSSTKSSPSCLSMSDWSISIGSWMDTRRGSCETMRWRTSNVRFLQGWRKEKTCRLGYRRGSSYQLRLPAPGSPKWEQLRWSSVNEGIAKSKSRDNWGMQLVVFNILRVDSNDSDPSIAIGSCLKSEKPTFSSCNCLHGSSSVRAKSMHNFNVNESSWLPTHARTTLRYSTVKSSRVIVLS